MRLKRMCKVVFACPLCLTAQLSGDFKPRQNVVFCFVCFFCTESASKINNKKKRQKSKRRKKNSVRFGWFCHPEGGRKLGTGCWCVLNNHKVESLLWIFSFLLAGEETERGRETETEREAAKISTVAGAKLDFLHWTGGQARMPSRFCSAAI